MNLANNLEASSFFFPERPAVRQAGTEWTYAQLDDHACRIATGLIKMGVKPGEHVGLCAINSADWIAFYFGVLKTGAVAVTLSALLSPSELELLITHARPRFVFSSENQVHELERLKGVGTIGKVIGSGADLELRDLMEMGTGSFKAIDRDRSDTAAILYTGGTTGTPKGVMLSHEGIHFSSHSIAYCERSTENDLALCFLPFNHVFGQIHIMNSTILSAGCLELIPSFDMEQVLRCTESGRVTKFYAVPTVYVRLLTVNDLKRKLGRLRYCFSAAASMPMEIVKEWKEASGVTISESYGMTEVMPVTYNHFYPQRHVVGSVGHPVPGVEVQIRDKSGNPLEQGIEGEICIRGRNVMKEYLNNPGGTRTAFWQGGWLRSGDIGVFDREGYLYIVDRLKDLIITGGENVYPREVEEALHATSLVLECSVVGFPDKEWGERVVAFVVPKPDKTITPAGLKAALKGRLASFKVPKEFIVTRDLPKSPTGKILKRELRKQYPLPPSVPRAERDM